MTVVTTVIVVTIVTVVTTVTVVTMVGKIDRLKTEMHNHQSYCLVLKMSRFIMFIPSRRLLSNLVKNNVIFQYNFVTLHNINFNTCVENDSIIIICDWACENQAYLHKLHMFRKKYIS